MTALLASLPTAGLSVSSLLAPGPLTGANPLYLLAVGSLGVFWLWRVWSEGRQGRRPLAAWLSLPGLLALLAAPRLDIPALFGMGAALLLLAEYGPGTYLKVKRRPRAAWLLGVLATGLALLVGAQWFAATGVLLGAAAGLVSALALPPAPARPPARRSLGFAARWQSARVPEWPELSLTLTQDGATLKNESAQALALAGWSPAHTNAWLLPLDTTPAQGGRPLRVLEPRASAFLPLGEREGGVRVWYAPAQDLGDLRLFRADWRPSTWAGRTLN